MHAIAPRALLALVIAAGGCAPPVPTEPAAPSNAHQAVPPAAAPKPPAPPDDSAKAPGAPPAASAPSALEPPKTFDLAAIDEHVARSVKERGFVGVSLAIMRNGKIVLAKGYGKSSLETGAPVEPDTSFGIGSVTKQFACAAVLLLAEDGKLSIDDKVAKYYPALTRAKDISLHDLLTHVSGYPDYYPLDFTDRRMMKPIAHDTLIQDQAGKGLDFEPRTRFSYSNTGFIIAGRVVEKVSGEPLARFLERRILKPLGMQRSFLDPRRDQKGLATGYSSFLMGEHEPAVPEGEGWLYAAGGIFASASDLLRWDLGLVDGKVLKPKSYERMIAPRTLADGTPKTYACGIVASQRSGELVLQHGGAASGFLAYNTIIPRTRSAVALLTNNDDVSAGSLNQEIVSLLLKDHQAASSKPPAIKGPPPKDVALTMVRALAGHVALDRATLGDEYSHYLDDAKVRRAAPRLKALGEPEKIDVEDVGERGGMEVASIRITFKTATVRANLYRSPDGKIQQFLMYKP